MNKWLLILSLLVAVTAFAEMPVQLVACDRALTSAYLLDQLNKTEPAGSSRATDQSLNFLGHNPNGQIVLFKSEGLPWASAYSHRNYQNSPQGDPRWFFYFAGTELALNFGFEIKKEKEGSVFLAPNADTLKKIVDKLNPILIKNGNDPIVFLPVKAGFLTADKMLKLLLSAKEPYLSFFPYEDNNPNLTAHEIAFHLIAMLFPKKFHQKAHEIDLETQKVASEILKLNSVHSRKIAMALIEARTGRVDAGTGNFAANVALLRMKNNIQPYRDLELPFEFHIGVNASVDKLASPSQSAQRSVTESLEKVLKQNFIGEPSKVFSDYLAMRKKLKDPLILFPNIYEDADMLTQEFFQTMDGRIDQINQAFKEIHRQTDIN